MGTRFMATVECHAHSRVKQAVISATDTGTIVFARKTGISRCLRNEYTGKHIELEAKGASFEELRDFERTCPSLGEWRRLAGALIAGNVEVGSVAMGAGAGMITEVLPCAEVIGKIVRNYDEVIKRLESE